MENTIANCANAMIFNFLMAGVWISGSIVFGTPTLALLGFSFQTFKFLWDINK